MRFLKRVITLSKKITVTQSSLLRKTWSRRRRQALYPFRKVENSLLIPHMVKTQKGQKMLGDYRICRTRRNTL